MQKVIYPFDPWTNTNHRANQLTCRIGKTFYKYYAIILIFIFISISLSHLHLRVHNPLCSALKTRKN